MIKQEIENLNELHENTTKKPTQWNNITQTVGIQMSEDVRMIQCSPDGKHIACGMRYNIKIFDANILQQVGEDLSGHTKALWSIKYSPNGQFLVSGSMDWTIRLWDVQTYKQIGGNITGHRGEVCAVSFSIDGQYIISGSWDYTIRIWIRETQKQDGISLKGHLREIREVQQSFDGQFIISGSADSTIRIWSFNKRQQIKKLNANKLIIFTVQYSFDNNFFMAGTHYGVQYWNLKSNKQIRKTGFGNKESFYKVEMSPDSRLIFTSCYDKTVRLWNIITGKHIAHYRHADVVDAVQFSQDGKFILYNANHTLIITPIKQILN